jgi:hypothetical protein
MDKIIKHTSRDTTLKSLKESIIKGYIPKSNTALAKYRKVFDRLTISDEGLLLKDDKIIIPSRITSKALEKAHQGGHPGMSCMKRRMRAHFWFPDMDTIIENYVKSCKDCQIFTNKTTHSKLHHHRPKESWQDVNIDLFGPMPDNKHVLVVTDNMSRFPAAKIVPNTSAGSVTLALNNIYTDFGQPDSHRTDNGPPFNSEDFRQYSEVTGTKHIKTFPYHPQANPAECFMRPLGKAMKIAHHNHANKDQALNQLLANYRATPHSATGVAPGDIMFRSGYKTGFPATRPLTDKEVKEAREMDIQQRSERTDRLNNSTHRKEDDIQVGDRVYTRINNRTSKFQPLFDPNTSKITSIGNGGVTCTNSSGKTQRRHLDDVKKATSTAGVPNTEHRDHVTSSGASENEFLITRNGQSCNNVAPETQATAMRSSANDHQDPNQASEAHVATVLSGNDHRDSTTIERNQQQTSANDQPPPTTIAEPTVRPKRAVQPPLKYRSQEFSSDLRPKK